MTGPNLSENLHLGMYAWVFMRRVKRQHWKSTRKVHSLSLSGLPTAAVPFNGVAIALEGRGFFGT